MTHKRLSQGIEFDLTEYGFTIANQDWVWDPGQVGMLYGFGPVQRAAGLDRIMYGVMKFPLQPKRWTARHRSLLAGIRREAQERRVPPSQALWLVTREALHDVLKLPELRGVWADPKAPEVMAAWGKRLRRAMNREVSRRLLAPEYLARMEVSLEEIQEPSGTVPTETDVRLALEKLLADPRLTPGDQALVRALVRTGGDIRLAAIELRCSEKAVYEQRRRLQKRLEAG
jgi:hypothetical protein